MPPPRRVLALSSVRRTPEELVRALSHLGEDVLSEDYPIEEIARELRSHGLDPEAVGREGVALVAALTGRRAARACALALERPIPVNGRRTPLPGIVIDAQSRDPERARERRLAKTERRAKRNAKGGR